MSRRCPVQGYGKITSNVGTLFSHLINIHDETHDKWLESYCKINNINLMGLLVDHVNEVKNATSSLTNCFKRDFTID
jgi:hypothetical protein